MWYPRRMDAARGTEHYGHVHASRNAKEWIYGQQWRYCMRSEFVLVTGGSGFVGAHCIAQLLNAGYRVRTTMRTRA